MAALFQLSKNSRAKNLKTSGAMNRNFAKFLTDTGGDSKLVHRRKRPKVDTLFFSLFFRRVRATSMTQRRVENTRVHFWTFSPVSVKFKWDEVRLMNFYSGWTKFSSYENNKILVFLSLTELNHRSTGAIHSYWESIFFGFSFLFYPRIIFKEILRKWYYFRRFPRYSLLRLIQVIIFS